LSSSSFGNDFLHGSHQVAQKSTIATLPCSDSVEIVAPPETAGLENAGAAFPMSGWPSFEEGELAPSSDAAQPPRNDAITGTSEKQDQKEKQRIRTFRDETSC
jgi:hypothetical protein